MWFASLYSLFRAAAIVAVFHSAIASERWWRMACDEEAPDATEGAGTV